MFALTGMHCFAGAQSVLVYATMYGSVVGWDLRAPGTAWKLDNDLKKGINTKMQAHSQKILRHAGKDVDFDAGVMTTFCVDPHQSWLAVGTSSGYIICWDLRFQLPISIIEHPIREFLRSSC